MGPLPFHTALKLDKPADVQMLSAIVQEWEPHLELYRPPRGSFLYEPDGTLYGFALGKRMTFTTDRRSVTVSAGDLVVIPQGRGVDAGVDVDLIALRHDGTPPDHFRERFIQVWGFEHLPISSSLADNGERHEIVPPSEVRLRIPYAILNVNSVKANVGVGSDDLVILVAFTGELSVRVAPPENIRITALLAREAMAIEPGRSWNITGTGQVGILTLRSELAHEACRWESHPNAFSHEYPHNSGKS